MFTVELECAGDSLNETEPVFAFIRPSVLQVSAIDCSLGTGGVEVVDGETVKRKEKSWLGKFRAGLVSPARIIGYVALCVFIFLRIVEPPILQDVRNAGFDFLHQQNPREYKPLPVRIIDIDEKSLEEIGQWPWPRTIIARLIDRLSAYGVAVTGFDIVFSEPDRYSPRNIANDNPSLPEGVRQELSRLPANELSMALSMQKHPVVLGEASVRSLRDAQDKMLGQDEKPPAFVGSDPRPFLKRFPYLVENLPELNQHAAGKGVFVIDPGRDNIIRQVPLVMLVGDKMRLALSTEMLRIATGGQSYVTKANDAGLQSIVIRPNQIVTDRNGMLWPYFTRQVPQRYVSASDVLNGKADPQLLQGHLAIIGTSASGLEDLRAIPMGYSVPGVEIHAQIIENIMTGETLARPYYMKLVELLVISLLGIIIIWLAPLFAAFLSAVLFFVLTGSLAGYSWYSFASNRILFDATWPIITTTGMFVLVETVNYMREEQQKRQIRDAFGQYLSPALVGRLSENPEELVLGGETRELTVLFTDVRGFTGISESYKDYPQGLTLLMNRFLTELSRPILERNGTIDKYMGDAIMAFWNAPLDFEHHVMQSCHAALDMIENVDALNKAREIELQDSETETYLPINVGIGINTGTCVVGNMGSIDRFDYTALGDTVNIASRLEGQSKPYGLPIVIGPQTAETVQDTLAVFEIDLIRVKGKNEPIRIYSLAGRDEMAKSYAFKEFQRLNETMMNAYRSQDWNTARAQFGPMSEAATDAGFFADDYIALFAERIDTFQNTPPGEDWDGVYTADSK